MNHFHERVLYLEAAAELSPCLPVLTGVYGIERDGKDSLLFQYGRKHFRLHPALPAGSVEEPEHRGLAVFGNGSAPFARLEQADFGRLHAYQGTPVEVGEELGVHFVEFAAHRHGAVGEPLVVDVDGDRFLAHYARFLIIVEEPQGDVLPGGGIGGGAYHVVGFARLAVLVFGADAPHVDLHEAVQLLIAVLAARGEDGSGQQTEKQQYLLKH